MDTDAPGIRAALEQEAMPAYIVHFPEQQETYDQAYRRMQRENRIKEAQATQRRKMFTRLRLYPRDGK